LWGRIKLPDDLTGFSAGAYRNTATGEIVIAYTGTNDAFFDWTEANIPAGFGVANTPQVTKAINFYSDVVSAYGTNVTFTGHSLGGGLASLMSVFFDKPATIFDWAPFQLSAIDPVNVAAYYAEYLAYQAMQLRPVDPSFSLYTASFSTLFGLREGNVIGLSLDGEILSTPRFLWPDIVGTEVPPYSVGENDLGSITLHSMFLLTAVMMSPGLRNALNELPFSVDVLMDDSLYSSAISDGNVRAEFLRYLIRNQVGVQGTDNPTGNGMLDLFAIDLAKLHASGSTALKYESREVDFKKALIATLMEYYYFADVSNGAPVIEFSQKRGNRW
jgi:hypothetical protein